MPPRINPARQTALATLALLSPFLLASSCSPSTPKPRGESASGPLTHTASVRPNAPLVPLPMDDGVNKPRTSKPGDPRQLENPQHLAAFFDKLARIEAGEPMLKARAVHYGDSHIASDMLTGVLRRHYQGRFGDGGHGFILPGKPWRTYHHMDVDFGDSRTRDWSADRIRVRDTGTDGLLGLGGVSMRTTRRDASVWVATEDDGPVGDKVSSFEIFYLKQPNGARMSLSLDGRPAGTINTRARATGPGYHTLRAPDGPHRLEIRAAGGGELRLFGTALERDAAGVVYDSVGINGARHSMPTYWNIPLWQSHLTHRGHDLIVTAYGSNEVGDNLDFAQYTAQVVKVMKDFKDASPSSSCLILGPPDQALIFDGTQIRLDVMDSAVKRAANDPSDPAVWDTPQKLLDIIEALRAAADQSGCAFFNTYEAIGGAGTIDTWARANPPLAHKDRVHMTSKGYALIADMIFEATMRAYDAHKAIAQPNEIHSNRPTDPHADRLADPSTDLPADPSADLPVDTQAPEIPIPAVRTIRRD